MFAPNAKVAYESMGIDFREKSIIYSDSLNVEKALDLKKQCEAIGFKGSQKCINFAHTEFIIQHPLVLGHT